MSQTKRLGAMGEQLARAHLEGQGLRLLMQNVKRPGGEIDLVMQDGKCIVFVEVKLRRREERPAFAVDRRKQQRICKVAMQLMVERGWMDCPIRFDVVEVIGELGEISLNHIARAFDCRGGAW